MQDDSRPRELPLLDDFRQDSSIESERGKWAEYYQGLQPEQSIPADVAELGDELRAMVEEVLPAGANFLEAGCGAGWQSLALARSGRYKANLLDFSEEALAFARNVFRRAEQPAEFHLGNASEPGIPEYDLVFNSGVIEHYNVQEQVQLLRGMASRSRRFVLVLAPNAHCYWYSIARIRSASHGNWPFGKEVAVSDLRPVFEAAGLHVVETRYLGRSWTELFVRNLPEIDDDLRQIILQYHRSPLTSPEQGCYLIAVLASIGDKTNTQNLQTQSPGNSSRDELISALTDALALRVAAERRLRLADERLEATTQELETFRRTTTERERACEALELLSAKLQGQIDELEKRVSLSEHERQCLVETVERQRQVEPLVAAGCAETLQAALDETTRRLADREEQVRRLASEIAEAREVGRELAEARRLLAEAEERAGALHTAGLRYVQAFENSLNIYRSQRAWRLMLEARRAYSMIVRRGLKGAIRLLFGPRHPIEEYELRFPSLTSYLPPPAEHDMNPTSASPKRRCPSAEALGPRRYDVIVLAIVDFDFRFQRPQQIAAQLARDGHRVFWVSATRVLPPNAPECYRAIPLRDGIWEIHLRAPQCDPYMGVLSDNVVREFRASLEPFYRDWAIAETCIMVQLPFWRRLALELRREPSSVLLYDCMDDWDTFENLGDFNRTEEVPLAAECDVLSVTASKLQEKFIERGLKPVLARNGADFAFFSAAEPLTELAELRQPVVGYFGAIADWIDLDLVYEVAKSRPQYTFVMAGQVFGRDTSALQSLPNVRLLGSRPYEQMPALLAAFNVCIIPFLLNQVTHATDPVKLYEYLSQGKPVVATDMQELRGWADLLYLARGSDEFAGQLDRAIAEADPSLRDRRIDFARTNSWASRVAVLDRAVRDRYPKVSVLVVSYNSAEYLAPCLRALLANTSYPALEIIVVDNASQDDSAAIAERFRDVDDRIGVVRLPENTGFAGGNNMATRMASGEHIIFLNADAIVTPGWIGYLLRHLTLDPTIGLICPVTNFAGNEAKINIQYSTEAEMRAFAMRIARENRDRTLDIAVAPLFCALMRRDVFLEIGGLDEGFQIGMFEDDDLSEAVRQRGLRVCAAEDCFVHHFGQGSFSKLASDEYNRIFEANRNRFEKKWNRTWVAHKPRPHVRPVCEEPRYTPAQFCEGAPGFSPHGANGLS